MSRRLGSGFEPSKQWRVIAVALALVVAGTVLYARSEIATLSELAKTLTARIDELQTAKEIGAAQAAAKLAAAQDEARERSRRGEADLEKLRTEVAASEKEIASLQAQLTDCELVSKLVKENEMQMTEKEAELTRCREEYDEVQIASEQARHESVQLSRDLRLCEEEGEKKRAGGEANKGEREGETKTKGKGRGKTAKADDEGEQGHLEEARYRGVKHSLEPPREGDESTAKEEEVPVLPMKEEGDSETGETDDSESESESESADELEGAEAEADGSEFSESSESDDDASELSESEPEPEVELEVVERRSVGQQASEGGEGGEQVGGEEEGSAELALSGGRVLRRVDAHAKQKQKRGGLKSKKKPELKKKLNLTHHERVQSRVQRGVGSGGMH